MSNILLYILCGTIQGVSTHKSRSWWKGCILKTIKAVGMREKVAQDWRLKKIRPAVITIIG